MQVSVSLTPWCVMVTRIVTMVWMREAVDQTIVSFLVTLTKHLLTLTSQAEGEQLQFQQDTCGVENTSPMTCLLYHVLQVWRVIRETESRCDQHFELWRPVQEGLQWWPQRLLPIATEHSQVQLWGKMNKNIMFVVMFTVNVLISFANVLWLI